LGRFVKFFFWVEGLENMSASFTESVVEQAALAWLEALDYTILSGPEIIVP